MSARGARYARQISGAWMRPDTLARLDRHRALGHAVVLVSASLEPYLEPLGALLGVDAVLCTRLEVGGDGRLTGRLDGRNCRGPEKADRLRSWLDEHRLRGASVWAYGDSRGDRELLALADRAELVKGRELGDDAALAPVGEGCRLACRDHGRRHRRAAPEARRDPRPLDDLGAPRVGSARDDAARRRRGARRADGDAPSGSPTSCSSDDEIGELLDQLRPLEEEGGPLDDDACLDPRDAAGLGEGTPRARRR